MILPPHLDDNKYDVNKYDDNKYDDNKYGLILDGLVQHWWPRSHILDGLIII